MTRRVNRKRNQFQLSNKKHSITGMTATVMSLLLLALYAVFVGISAWNEEAVSLYLGSIGVIAVFLGIVVFAIAVRSLREEEVYAFFPRLGLILSILAETCWIATYILGFITNRG